MAPKVRKQVPEEEEEEDIELSSSESGSEAGSVSEGKKRRTKKAFVSFDFAANAPENRKYPHLDNKQFKLLIDSLVVNFKDVLEINQKVYSGKDKNITKIQAKKLGTQFAARLKQVNSYHKAKGTTGHKQSAQHLIEPFFVTDNIHDWIGDTNMGNGLADLLVHYLPGRTKASEFEGQDHAGTLKDKYDADEFIKLANTKLGKKKTNKDELSDLIYTHHPGYVASEDVEQMVFELDDANLVKPEDASIVRIVQIHNAYADAFNEKYGLTKGNPGFKPRVTAEQAAANAVPQTAVVPYADGTVNVDDVLNLEITVQNPYNVDEQVTYRTSAINSGMNTTILTVMSNANKLSEPENGRLIHYDLFERYFNGADDNYPQGKNTGLWFDGHDLTFTPGGGKTVKAETVARELRDSHIFPHLASKSKSKTQAAQIEAFANRVSNVYSKKPMTAFELMNHDYSASKEKAVEEGKMEEEKVEEGRPYVQKEGNEPYGMRNFSGTKICFMFKVPEDYLTDDARAILADDDFKAKVLGVQRYLSKLNASYSAYLREEKNLRAKTRKEHKAEAAKEQKEVKKVRKVQGTKVSSGRKSSKEE